MKIIIYTLFYIFMAPASQGLNRNSDDYIANREFLIKKVFGSKKEIADQDMQIMVVYKRGQHNKVIDTGIIQLSDESYCEVNIVYSQIPNDDAIRYNAKFYCSNDNMSSLSVYQLSYFLGEMIITK